MPYSTTDSQKFNARSWDTATYFGMHSLYVPIHEVADNMNDAVATAVRSSLGYVNVGNIRSRMRMVVLYTICHHVGQDTGKRARVVGTGNLSEDYIGYDTKGGDALCDFFPIGDLFKSEVYQLLDYFIQTQVVLDRHVDRVPSAGLWEGQTDEKELGFTYDEMELAIRDLLIGDDSLIDLSERDAKVKEFVMKRHLENCHKHQAPLSFPLRDLIDKY